RHTIFSRDWSSDVCSSDLNWISQQIFSVSLTVSGICLILFFVGLPVLFRKNGAKLLILFAAISGIIAGICYIGIANAPWNIDIRSEERRVGKVCRPRWSQL